MIFNSIYFAIFLVVVYILYWFVLRNNFKFQNILLLSSSFFFYSCWDYRFLFLLVFSITLDYYSGIKINESGSHRTKSFWFWLSISVNLGFLAIFKYYNFFVSSFEEALSHLGIHVNLWTLNVILPVGISFYTFHGLSYVIDIYKGRAKPVTEIVDYALFVSFFPLLVAGPIERATHLLPQIQKKRNFNYSETVDGLRQILWGLFKKIVIADNCAEFVNIIFNNSNNLQGSILVIGAILFSFQIYGDFSGYSDIALGTARLFGVELLKNFSFPYFSRDIAEFWRRWHISLSSWFRDYLYIPLGGSVGDSFMKIRNTFVVFLVSGFWHGAKWTFIVWGFLHAVYFLPLLLLKKNRNNIDIVAKDRLFPSFTDVINIGVTFSLVTFAWIFFRADNIAHALRYIRNIVSSSLFSFPEVIIFNTTAYSISIICSMIVLFITIEWIGRENSYAIEKVGTTWRRPLIWTFYYALVFSIIFFTGHEQQFIYFQF